MIKILFIASNQTTDFLADAVFYGLRELEHVSVVDSNRLWYMYDDINQRELINRVHGRGFTYYASIKEGSVDRDNLESRIISHEFDKIIYGNVHRNLEHLETVLRYYSKEDIILLDGNDNGSLKQDLLGKGIYYRRENDISTRFSKDFYPINFAYPTDKFINEGVDKDKLLGTVIPGHMDTFIFNDQNDYFNDYRRSYFAFTWKKSGWDCLRHYEILGNGCIPLFLDIEYCPNTNMVSYPKNLLKEYYKESGIYDVFRMGDPIEYDDKNTRIVNRDLKDLAKLTFDNNFLSLYGEYFDLIMKYAYRNNTTIELAKYVIS